MKQQQDINKIKTIFKVCEEWNGETGYKKEKETYKLLSTEAYHETNIYINVQK